MYFIGLIIIILLLLLIIVVGNIRHDLQVSHERELLELRQANLYEQKKQNKLDSYVAGLEQERIRLEKELDELDQEGLPTKEQMKKAMWYMNTTGMIPKEQTKEITKIYDPRRIWELGEHKND